MVRRANGFSLVELIIAMGIMLTITAAIFGLMDPAQGTFSAQPEVADMQQRLRVAQDALQKDLIMAGAGLHQVVSPEVGPAPQPTLGALGFYFAPVLPFRQGAVADDGVGQFFSDRITLFYVPSTSAQGVISALAPPPGNGPPNDLQAGADNTFDIWCPTIDPMTNQTCGVGQGHTILIVDDTGNYDTFSVTKTNGAIVTVNKPADAAPTTYQAGSQVVEIVGRTYSMQLFNDPVTKTAYYRLMSYDGTVAANDAPVVDHVVGLTFTYFGDPQPPQLTGKPFSSAGPWTTYGPKPPALGAAGGTAYPLGENCAFAVAGGAHVPRLATLAGGNSMTLVQLGAPELTDGPWCPDVNNANRWDADLLRIRKIGIKLRVEATVDALRGPAGPLFTRAGTSRGGNKWVPDQELSFEVSPRNLNLNR